MKANVNKSTCIGCGLCASIASSIFAVIEDGFAENILNGEIPLDLEDAVTEASESCPVSAIDIE